MGINISLQAKIDEIEENPPGEINQASTEAITDDPPEDASTIPISGAASTIPISGAASTIPNSGAVSIIPISGAAAHPVAESCTNGEGASTSTSQRLVYKRKQTDEEENSTDDGEHSRLCDGRSTSAERHTQQNARQIESLEPDPVEEVRRREGDESLARALQALFDAETDSDSDDDDSDDDESEDNESADADSADADSDDDESDDDESDEDDSDDDDYVSLSQGSCSGFSESEINRLPTRKYAHPPFASPSSTEAPHKRPRLNGECAVCLIDYELGDELRTLTCYHEFHASCIDKWLKKRRTCPVCRLIMDLGGS